MGCSPSKNLKKDEGEKSSDLTNQARRASLFHQDVSLNSRKMSQALIGSDNPKETTNDTQKGPNSSDEKLIELGSIPIFRPRQLQVVGAFPREDTLLTSLRSAVDKTNWSFTWVKSAGYCSCTSPSTYASSSLSQSEYQTQLTLASWKTLTDQLSLLTSTKVIDLLILDYRQVKIPPTESFEKIKSLKSQKLILVVIAYVKKSFFDKPDGLNLLLETGIDKVEVDHGITSNSYWLSELTQMEKSLVDVSYKLATTEALVAALDNCRDLIQITDSHNRIQFVNRAYEKLLGFSSAEVIGSDFIDIQTKSEQSWAGTRQSPVPSAEPNPNRSTTPTNLPGRHEGTSPSNPHLPPLSQQPLQSSTLSTATTQHQTFHDHVLEDLSQGKQWEGNYMYSKKTGEPIFLNSRLFPFSYHRTRNRLTHLQDLSIGLTETSSGMDSALTKVATVTVPATHYIYLCDAPAAYRQKSFSADATHETGGYNPMPRGSLKSLRKASYDIKPITTDNSMLRRQSLAKLHSLTIEAPITKVINLITAAQQSCPIYIAHSLEKVLEILRTTELYSPQFFEGNRTRTDDLMTDLLGALLSQGPKPASTMRRSSNENTASRLAPRPSLPDIAEAPGRLQRLLETESRWDFDVILLEEITEKRPLVWTGMAIFSRFGVAQTLGTDDATLRNWLTLIEANYHSTNAYHNSTHAADVLQATAYFLSTERLKTFLEPLDEVVALLSAVVHDVDHPGKTSHFLTNTGNELALLYNDLSVLESHHAAFAFKLSLSDPRVNIFKNLDTDTYKQARWSIVDMVLATEMTKHFEHLSKFVNVFTKPLLEKDEDLLTESQAQSSSGLQPSLSTEMNPNSPVVTPTEPDISTLVTPDNIILIRRMLIKCADVANPTRPLKLCIVWANRIAEEYFRQTEEEISRGLPRVMPMFERETCSIPKSQTGFVEYFVADMFEAWDAFLDVPEVIENMKFNYDFWKDLDSKGIQSAGQVTAYLRQMSGSSPYI